MAKSFSSLRHLFCLMTSFDTVIYLGLRLHSVRPNGRQDASLKPKANRMKEERAIRPDETKRQNDVTQTRVKKMWILRLLSYLYNLITVNKCQEYLAWVGGWLIAQRYIRRGEVRCGNTELSGQWENTHELLGSVFKFNAAIFFQRLQRFVHIFSLPGYDFGH